MRKHALMGLLVVWGVASVLLCGSGENLTGWNFIGVVSLLLCAWAGRTCRRRGWLPEAREEDGLWK